MGWCQQQKKKTSSRVTNNHVKRYVHVCTPPFATPHVEWCTLIVIDIKILYIYTQVHNIFYKLNKNIYNIWQVNCECLGLEYCCGLSNQWLVVFTSSALPPPFHPHPKNCYNAFFFMFFLDQQNKDYKHEHICLI